jgi:hypothetical protein
VAKPFDHLVGAPEDRQRYSKPERLRCLEIDNEFDFRRVPQRRIGWLFAIARAGSASRSAKAASRSFRKK